MPAPQLQTYGPADVHVHLDSTPSISGGTVTEGTLREISLPIQSFGDWSVDEVMFDSARGFSQRWQAALPMGVAETGELSLDVLVDTRENSIDSVLGAPDVLTPRSPTRTLRVTWGPRSQASSNADYAINNSGGYDPGDTALTVDAGGAAALDVSTDEQFVEIEGHIYRVAPTPTPTATAITIDRGAGANRSGLLTSVGDNDAVKVVKLHFREVEGYVKGRTLKLDRDNLQMWTVAFQPVNEVIGSA